MTTHTMSGFVSRFAMDQIIKLQINLPIPASHTPFLMLDRNPLLAFPLQGCLVYENSKAGKPLIVGMLIGSQSQSSDPSTLAGARG
jgi:hypothetical protein